MVKKIVAKFNQILRLPIKRSTQIIYPGVPHEPEKYLSLVSPAQVTKKFLHKYLLLKIYGQLKLQKTHAPHNKKILWLYTGKKNIGDAVMDLSGRSLLKNQSIHIDLLTLPHLKAVFKEDNIFRNVYALEDNFILPKYDFILISEFNLPSIRLKKRFFKDLEFACLYDFFYGPDRNQTIFSYAAINSIFNLGLGSKQIHNCAKPYLHQNNVPKKIHSTEIKIAIGVGGIDDNRTYKKWGEVLDLIDQDPNAPEHVFLLGSSNGITTAKEIDSKTFKRLKVINKVNTTDLLSSRAIISQSSLYVGCDGGLMHIAHTTSTPSVSIFNQSEPPSLRLTASCYSQSIHSTGEVSAVSARKIYESIKLQLKNHNN